MSKDYKKELAMLGCGDSSCCMGRIGGMCVNGGCRCFTGTRLNRAEERRHGQKIARLAREMVEEIGVLNAVIADCEEYVRILTEENNTFETCVVEDFREQLKKIDEEAMAINNMQDPDFQVDYMLKNFDALRQLTESMLQNLEKEKSWGDVLTMVITGSV